MQLKLKKPIILADGATPIEALNLREAVTAGDLRSLRADWRSSPTNDDLLTIAARLSGQAAVVLNKLSLEDMDAVLSEVVGFLAPGRETGKTQ